MKIHVHNECPPYETYRANRVKSLFNVETGAGTTVDFELELPIEEGDWKVGMVVGPSGSGKTSIVRELEKDGWLVWGSKRWKKDSPLIDSIGGDDFDAATGSLASVGLGTVPSWLRPFHVLSVGEQFRAEMARILVQEPEKVILDEFTSTIDRKVACIGAMAFTKAWRRTKGQLILATCHHDVVEWAQPDWVYDTGTGEFRGREGLQPPTGDDSGSGPDRVVVLEIAL